MKCWQTGLTVGQWKIAFFIYIVILLSIMLLADLGMLKGFILAHPPYDKLGHFILYGIASFLSHGALNRQHFLLLNISWPVGPVIFSAFTALEEILQEFLPNRSASLEDFAASMSGIILGYWLSQKLSK